MIFANNTPNNVGVAIYGDYQDFEYLYEALHHVVGDEGEKIGYDPARIRVLGVCYDLRHAIMGNRDYEFIDNGLDDEKQRHMSVRTPNKNFYLKIYVLWPEMLFVMMALNDFIKVYAEKKTKKRFIDVNEHPKIRWDATIAHVRMLQSAISTCLQQTISANTYVRLLNVMNGPYVSTYNYLTQYIDILNDKFINMSNEKRLKNISIFAKRIAERGVEYEEMENRLRDEAKKHSCSVHDLRFNIEYPDKIEW